MKHASSQFITRRVNATFALAVISCFVGFLSACSGGISGTGLGGGSNESSNFFAPDVLDASSGIVAEVEADHGIRVACSRRVIAGVDEKKVFLYGIASQSTGLTEVDNDIARKIIDPIIQMSSDDGLYFKPVPRTENTSGDDLPSMESAVDLRGFRNITITELSGAKMCRFRAYFTAFEYQAIFVDGLPIASEEQSIFTACSEDGAWFRPQREPLTIDIARAEDRGFPTTMSKESVISVYQNGDALDLIIANLGENAEQSASVRYQQRNDGAFRLIDGLTTQKDGLYLRDRSVKQLDTLGLSYLFIESGSLSLDTENRVDAYVAGGLFPLKSDDTSSYQTTALNIVRERAGERSAELLNVADFAPVNLEVVDLRYPSLVRLDEDHYRLYVSAQVNVSTATEQAREQLQTCQTGRFAPAILSATMRFSSQSKP